MAKETSSFEEALKGKRIPILTLDNNWHKLFTQTEPTDKIKELEEKLNALLRKQGKLNSQIKEIKSLKKRLMDEIVELMNDLGDKEPSKSVVKKLDDNKRLIEECNEKIDSHNDELYDLPKMIDQVNYELMLKTMEICYEQIRENNEEIARITKWIDGIRIELKKNLAIKEQKATKNQNFYSYMHNIFGAEVIDIFDMKYEITNSGFLD